MSNIEKYVKILGPTAVYFHSSKRSNMQKYQFRFQKLINLNLSLKSQPPLKKANI